jgi:endothelin-converting enzyme
LNPSPDADLLVEDGEWLGAWEESYAITDELLSKAAKVEELKAAAMIGRNKAATAQQPRAELEEALSPKVDEKRSKRLTKTLAWLHSRGK